MHLLLLTEFLLVWTEETTLEETSEDILTCGLKIFEFCGTCCTCFTIYLYEGPLIMICKF